MIFLDNYCGWKHGGALSISSIGTVAISDSHFLNNRVGSGRYGGAIWLGNFYNISQTSVMFVGNWAAKGCGIYVDSHCGGGWSPCSGIPTFTCDKCEFQKNQVSSSYTQCGEQAGPNVFFSREAPITDNAAAYFKGCTFENCLTSSRMDSVCGFYSMGIFEFGVNLKKFWRCGGSGIRMDPATTRIYSDNSNTCNSDSDSLAIKSEPYKTYIGQSASAPSAYDISAILKEYMNTSPGLRSRKIPFKAFFTEDVCKLSKEWSVPSGIDKDNYACRCRSDLYPNEDHDSYPCSSDDNSAKCKVAYMCM